MYDTETGLIMCTPFRVHSMFDIALIDEGSTEANLAGDEVT